MIEIPQPYTITQPDGQVVINPEVLAAQRASYYFQRMAYEGGRTVGVYDSDGNVHRFNNQH